MRGANGVLFVSDLTNYETLTNIQEWIEMVTKNSNDLSLVFLGNKSDPAGKEFGLNALKQVADAYSSPSYITSAKTGDNVEKAFHDLCKNAIKGKVITPDAAKSVDISGITISSNVAAMDKVMDAFCKAVGGYNIGLPILDKSMDDLGIDFEHCTKDEMVKLTDSLIAVFSPTHTDEQTDLLKSEFDKAMEGL